jgi:hypothetical protein
LLWLTFYERQRPQCFNRASSSDSFFIKVTSYCKSCHPKFSYIRGGGSLLCLLLAQWHWPNSKMSLTFSYKRKAKWNHRLWWAGGPHSLHNRVFQTRRGSELEIMVFMSTWLAFYLVNTGISPFITFTSKKIRIYFIYVVYIFENSLKSFWRTVKIWIHVIRQRCLPYWRQLSLRKGVRLGSVE